MPDSNYSKETKTLTMERVFDAPSELVWEAWTNPEHLSQWWSPDTFTVPKCELDVRPEGAIHIDMQSPDGTIFPMDAVYKEVVKPEKLVFLSTVPDSAGNPIFQVHQTVLFSEKDGKTTLKLIWKVVHETPEAQPFLSGMEQGLSQSLQKLAHFLSAK